MRGVRKDLINGIADPARILSINRAGSTEVDQDGWLPGSGEGTPQDVGKDTSQEGDSTASQDDSLCQDG